MKTWNQPPKVKRAIILNILTLGIFSPFMVAVVKRKNRDRIFFILNLLITFLIGADGQKPATLQSGNASTPTSALSVLGFIFWIALFIAAFIAKPKITAKYEKITEELEVGISTDAKGEESAVSKDETLSENKYVIRTADDSSSTRSGKPTKYLVSKYSEGSRVSSLQSRISDVILPRTPSWSDRRKAKKLGVTLEKIRVSIYEIEQRREKFENLSSSLNLIPGKSKIEYEILQVSGCTLIEPRKGARKTESTSTSSGRAFGGVRAGPFFIGGSGSSTRRGSSVSYPAPDVLERVDQGKFILSTHGVSFAGSLFTKNTEYKKMLDFDSDSLSILIAPRTGNKVWIVQFPEGQYSSVIETVLDVVIDSESKIIDDSEPPENQTKIDLIGSKFKIKIADLENQISERRDLIESVKDQITRLIG